MRKAIEMKLQGKINISPIRAANSLGYDDAKVLHQNIPEWTLTEYGITRTFYFNNFKEAMRFTERVSELAEEEGHYPSFYIYDNKVCLEFIRHEVKGYSENDFILAKKINMLANNGDGLSLHQ